MIRKLRKRLTVILTVLTGWVVVALLIATMSGAVQRIQSEGYSQFSQYIGYLLVGQDSQQEALRQLAGNSSYTISLKKNNETVSETTAAKELLEQAQLSMERDSSVWTSAIAGEAQPMTMVYLVPQYYIGQSSGFYIPDQEIQVAEGTAEGQGGAGVIMETISVSTTESLDEIYPSFQWQDQTYRTSLMQYTDGEDNSWELLLVQNLAQEKKDILLMQWLYIGLMLAGLALLAVVNWFLTKLIVKPTEEGLHRQTEFVAAASHELKSPLTVLRGSLSAAEIADTPEEAAAYRSRADKEAERMGRLISDLLLLAGSDSRNWRMESRTFDIDTMLIETKEQFEAAAREKGHTLELEMPEETMGEMKGDRDRIHQILAALLDNALEYSPTDTVITLKGEIKKGKLLLRVQDRGPGIAEEDKAQIFSRFYRADRSRSDKNHFGLGLSIAKELAVLHGGTITAENAPQGGAIFTLSLPLARN